MQNKKKNWHSEREKKMWQSTEEISRHSKTREIRRETDLVEFLDIKFKNWRIRTQHRTKSKTPLHRTHSTETKKFRRDFVKLHYRKQNTHHNKSIFRERGECDQAAKKSHGIPELEKFDARLTSKNFLTSNSRTEEFKLRTEWNRNSIA